MFSISFDPHMFATSTQCLLLRAGCCGKELFIPKSILPCTGSIACVQGASERVHVTKMPAWSLYESHRMRCPLSCIYQNRFHIKTHICESPPCGSSKGYRDYGWPGGSLVLLVKHALYLHEIFLIFYTYR